MGTLIEKLAKIKQTKAEIKDAIVNKGISVSDTEAFDTYSSKINSIVPSITQTKSQTITTNTTTTITPDSGYNGLSKVTITTNIPPSNLGSNAQIVYDLTPNESKQITVPAAAKYAVITVVTVYHSGGASAVSGTPQCSTSAGTLTAKGTPSYDKDFVATKPYVWTLTKNVGTAATITVRANYNATYGELHSFASVIY